MAAFEVAYRFMLANEDKTPPEYAIVPDAPPGAHAISGINSAAWPLLYPLIAAIPQSERGPFVEAFYEEHFWSQWYAQLTSDEVAKRVFDAAVNVGGGTAVRLLQRAANQLGVGGPIINEDGKWGPKTVDAANTNFERGSLVESFKKVRSDHYKDIVAKNPQDEKYLAAWLVRSQK